ncbi:MAG: hypothetical protein AAF587_25425 [Bacteroidota bacterium]
MSDNTLAPYLQLHQNHLPKIDPGEYQLTATSTYAGENSLSSKIVGDITGTTTSSVFAVYGERLSINPQEIQAMFPAPDSTGEYTNILPHIVISRNTLPWERSPYTSDDPGDNAPWLALLMFTEEEMNLIEKKSITVADLTASSDPYFPTFEAETAQQSTDLLTVIDVPATMLDSILPSTESLVLQAHTRTGTDSDGNRVGIENSILFCNRLPQAGKRSTMHLVSLEGRFNGSTFDTGNGASSYRLVSLKNWSFYSIEHFKISSTSISALSGKLSDTQLSLLTTQLDREFAGTEASFLQEMAGVMDTDLTSLSSETQQAIIDATTFSKTFNGLLTNLNKDYLTLRMPDSSNATANTYLAQGLVPLLHQFRNGDQSVSWYRGPFAPIETSSSSVFSDLYPETADELMKFDPAYGMFDMTYSAAWEIGRLLALTSKDFSISLYKWKHLLVQTNLHSSQSSSISHLPTFSNSSPSSLSILWDNHIEPWLTQLIALLNVPGNYLVPNEQLLTAESIRFFSVDKSWIEAALRGAFSIGGDWEQADQTSSNSFTDFLENLEVSSMGFLLRSDVVDGWPGLIIEGIDAAGNSYTPTVRKLARGILLCLFSAPVQTVNFHQKPEILHFGLIQENDLFYKKIRNELGLETGDPIAVNSLINSETGTIDILSLASTLGKAENPAQFAMNMIEGIPYVSFPVALDGTNTDS